jgi:26S proteasome regulatory subunit T6
MGKSKVLVKVHPEGKYVVDIDKDIDISKLTPGVRVALRNDSYQLHLLLPTKVDPLVSLMKVEKVPDSTYDMIGGCDQQIKEIKEVRSERVRMGAWQRHGMGEGRASRHVCPWA